MKRVVFLLGALALGSVPAMADENKEAPPPAPTSTSPVNTPTAAPTEPQKPPLVVQLESLVADLQMPSESDAPIRVWMSEPVDEPKAADFARMAGLHLKGDEPVETRSLSDLLDQPATQETWMSDDERNTARRFADLRDFLNAHFAEIEVFAWGTTEKQIVVAGKTETGFVGLLTLVVET